jgi:hypothetical protein
MSMTSCIDASPAVALAEIERELRNAPPPSADAVAAIKRQLAEFGAAAAAETVIESYYGCLVTEHLRRRFDIVPDTLPLIINSSHRAVRRVCVMPGDHLHCRVLKDSWASGWRTFRQQHRGVDMYVQTALGDRSLRHADLYVIAAGQIVSLEYKYVGPKGLTSPERCAAQMRPYLDAHAVARLIIYSGTPSTTPVRGMDKLRGLLPPDVPLVLYGPQVDAVGSPRNYPEQ